MASVQATARTPICTDDSGVGLGGCVGGIAGNLTKRPCPVTSTAFQSNRFRLNEPRSSPRKRRPAFPAKELGPRLRGGERNETKEC